MGVESILGGGGAQGAMLGVNVLGAAAQWVNSSRADKASKAEREKMQEVIDKMQGPNFNPANFTSEEYALASKYVPQLASYIEEQAPQTVQATADGQAGREAQLSALNRLKNLSETGEDLQSQVMRQRALGDAAAQNQAQQATITQNAAQRGVGGSGLEFLQSMMAQQGSAQDASRNAQDAALASYQTRLNAMKDSASLGGQVRDQDISEQARNAGIINDFNQRKTAEANRYQQYVANANNQAQQYNIGNQQRVMDANVSGRNADKARGQSRADMIENAKYGFNTDQANRQLGQYQGDSDAIQQRAGHTAAAIGGTTQAINSGINGYNQSQSANRDYALQKQKYDSLYGPRKKQQEDLTGIDEDNVGNIS